MFRIWLFRIFIISIPLIPLLSYFLWKAQSVKIVDIAIVDKTVVQMERNEHKSFNWVLTHNNYQKSDSTLYDANSDYFGFFPEEPIECKDYIIRDLEQLTLGEIDSLADSLEGVYYADMYGVYYNEWYLDSLHSEHSPKVYGGMSIEEVYLLEKMKDQGKMIFTEFNMLASPTPWRVRKKAQKLLGLKWTGWTGRFFDSFDTTVNLELPNWVVNLYTEQYDTTWHFKKSGVVLVHESEKIIILEEDSELSVRVPVIYSSVYCQNQYETAKSVHYPFWFDITFPTNTENATIANYKLHTTPKGDSILKAFKVPSEFPAVIEHKKDYWMHYYAGDFADNPFNDRTAYFKGIELFDMLIFDGAPNSREKFFWRFYQPLVTNMLDQYLNQEISKENVQYRP